MNTEFLPNEYHRNAPECVFLIVHIFKIAQAKIHNLEILRYPHRKASKGIETTDYDQIRLLFGFANSSWKRVYFITHSRVHSPLKILRSSCEVVKNVQSCAFPLPSTHILCLLIILRTSSLEKYE